MSDDPLDYPGRPPRVVPEDTFVAPTPAPTERADTTDTGPTPTVDLIGGEQVSGAMSPGASTGGQAGGAVVGELSGDAAFPTEGSAPGVASAFGTRDMDRVPVRDGIRPDPDPERGDDRGPGLRQPGLDRRAEDRD